MLLTGKAGGLAAAAKVAASSANSGMQIPILGSLLVEATDGSVKFTGTNLDMAMTAETAAIVKEPGCSAVPAIALSGLLTGIAADCEVTIATVDGGVRVQAGRSRYQLPALPPDDFPSAPIVSNDTELVLSHDQMRQLFGAIYFAISEEETRYYLCGSYLHFVEDRLAAVATNGTMLARAIMDMAPAPDTLPKAGVIIPKTAIEQIVKFKADEIRLRIDAKVLSAQVDKVTLTSKLIDATFPDYPRAIPAETNITAEIERSELLAAIERMASLVVKKKQVTLTLDWNGDDSVRLSMGGGEIAEDIIDAETTGEAKISLAVSRALTVIEALGAERLRLGFNSAGEPIRINPTNDHDLLAILMPCREMND